MRNGKGFPANPQKLIDGRTQKNPQPANLTFTEVEITIPRDKETIRRELLACEPGDPLKTQLIAELAAVTQKCLPARGKPAENNGLAEPAEGAD